MSTASISEVREAPADVMDDVVHLICVTQYGDKMIPAHLACCGTPDDSEVDFDTEPDVTNCPMCALIIKDDLPCVHFPGWPDGGHLY